MDKQPSAAAMEAARQWIEAEGYKYAGYTPADMLSIIVRYATQRERAALEQACQAVCDGCAGARTVENIRGKWWHPIIEKDRYYTPPMPCAANAIRALLDADEAEVTP